jgi:hypothetical protein
MPDAPETTLFALATMTLLRLVCDSVHASARLVDPDSVFEAGKPPSVVLAGPAITEDRLRRTQSRWLEESPDPGVVLDRPHPRMYHMDFEIVVTTANAIELLDYEEHVASFFDLNPTITIPERGELALTLLTPLGGLKRVNLSNLRQASGKCRIEDVPVFSGTAVDAHMILTRIFEYRDLNAGTEADPIIETRTYYDAELPDPEPDEPPVDA